MLKDRMVELLKNIRLKGATEEYKGAYADDCLDMYNEAQREHEEIFAEQTGGDAK